VDQSQEQTSASSTKDGVISCYLATGRGKCLTTRCCLVICSVLLVIVGFGQLRFIRKSLAVAELTAQAAMKSAEAAKESSKAMVAVELPIFIHENIEKNRPYFEFGNHGRTPAVITRHCLVFKIDAALPPEPHYPVNSIKKLDQARVVEKGHAYRIEQQPPLSTEEWERVFRRESILWVYGYIEYLDFLKVERRDGFCFAFDPAPQMYPTMPPTPNDGRWVQEGPIAYTYSNPKSEIR